MLKLYKEDDLLSWSDTFCPIVIQIETVLPGNYRGKGRRISQFTHGSLEKVGSQPPLYRFKAVAQKLLFNNQIMDLKDIYGNENIG